VQYHFGPFVADRGAYQVRRDGDPLDLTPKLLDLLFFLLERPQTLVTKEALLDGVWPDANVTENALAQAVSELREALGDIPSSPTYIRTIARRGYRFVAPVEVRTTDPTAGPGTESVAVEPGTEVADGRHTLAVLDFANVSGDPEVGWLAAGIAETVTTDFAALGHARVVDRWRVVQTARQSGGSMHDMGRALGADWIVTGSYQRSGSHLRITARLMDLSRGEALADAKVDGRIDDVFVLQDDIVGTFARELGLESAAAPPRVGISETASLDAYRSYVEGWLKLESLDTGLAAAAAADFEHAIGADPGYAAAYTGLAHAEFVAYEMTRPTSQPDFAALQSGISHARQAVRLSPDLAEAHATLSFLLASNLAFDEARVSARRAVALDSRSWRHQFRLGHASWGQDRLLALERALALYPRFAYALLEAAMVHVARGDLDVAARVAQSGIAEQDRQARSGHRFPAIGFHWLRGALLAAAGHRQQAIDAFDREVAQADARRLYGPEYAAVALVGKGHALLAEDQIDQALASFQEAGRWVAELPRACLGQALALGRLDRSGEAEAASHAVSAGLDVLEHTGRSQEAVLVRACKAAAEGDRTLAIDELEQFLAVAPVSHLGWTIPLEPALQGLWEEPEARGVLRQLAERAR